MPVTADDNKEVRLCLSILMCADDAVRDSMSVGGRAYRSFFICKNLVCEGSTFDMDKWLGHRLWMGWSIVVLEGDAMSSILHI